MSQPINTTMRWEQMLQALQMVSAAEVKMREPGNWYVCTNMMHASGNACLRGDFGNGRNPEEAVIDHWGKYGNGEPFCVGVSGDHWMRWNGFMWCSAQDPAALQKTTP